MREVTLPAADLRALSTVVPPGRLEELLDDDLLRRAALEGVAVINVNSTASGGGVAEMLSVLLPYARGTGVDARWLVIDGDERFFSLTKRLHNHLYGGTGDGGPLGDEEHFHYESVLRRNAAQLAAVVRPDDIVVLHDPQTAGLAAAMQARHARVVWRCHIGTELANDHTDLGWAFLRRYLDQTCRAYVFSRRSFAPDWLPATLVHEIAPSIDPFSPKNQALSTDDVHGILAAAGLIGGRAAEARYPGPDGLRRRLEHGADVLRTGSLAAPDVPMVVQISRWDRQKDMVGVLRGFADFVVVDSGTQLVLAGPVVTAVADDPEAAAVLQECWEAWRGLPHHARRRIALACLPMVDGWENAVIVNALQRHATVVVQKSLAEGFGLTVTEAMYKRRPVIASAVGGIVSQIVDGESGVLLPDPTDLDRFAAELRTILADPQAQQVMGERAHERVVERFLPDTQLRQWAGLLGDLLAVPG